MYWLTFVHAVFVTVACGEYCRFSFVCLVFTQRLVFMKAHVNADITGIIAQYMKCLAEC
jgi:hypothetical protein